VHDVEPNLRAKSSSEKCFEDPQYGPEVAPDDYHLFLHLNKGLVSQSLRSDQETKDVVRNWLRGLAATL
jgi:hypothetical protein